MSVEKKSSIIGSDGRMINAPIEQAHPADILFKAKKLSNRQQRLLDNLPKTGSQLTVAKNSVSMVDLSALTAHTGDEFAMFTRGRERLIVRGDKEQIWLSDIELMKLHNNGFRWSGHTHTGTRDVDLIASDGDRRALEIFKQNNSVIYNAAGKRNLIRNESDYYGARTL